MVLATICNYNNRIGAARDTDGFAERLSAAYMELREQSPVSLAAFTRKLGAVGTVFFRLNRIERLRYSQGLLPCLERLHLPGTRDRFLDLLLRFKRRTERNLHKAFWVTPSPQEETGRSLLQAFLPQESFREVETGAGRMDLVYWGENEVVETKVWRTVQEFEAGLIELAEYLQTEGKDRGYYVVFDPVPDGCKIARERGDQFDDHVNDKRITVVFVRIKHYPPSRARKLRGGSKH